MPNKRVVPKHVQDQKRKMRFNMAKELIWPTAPNEFARTALIQTDLSSTFTKQVAPYNTLGNQNFHWRATRELSTDITQSAAGDQPLSLTFRLTDFPGNTDFATVFDQYRLKAVSVVINPRNNVASVSTNLPRLYTAIDYDDANTVNRAQIMQYDTCVESPPGSGVVRAVVPRMAMAAYGSSAFSSYANVRDQWIDMASPSVEHYGLKVVVEQATMTTNLQTYVCAITGFFEFRATR